MDKNNKIISATELSKLGVCERKVYLESVHGQRSKSKEVIANMDRGNALHDRAYKTNHEFGNKDSRCFIASCVYGIDAIETNKFRSFRDKRLSNHLVGMLFIKLYYRYSPMVVRLIERAPFLKLPVKRTLNWILTFI